MLVRELRWTMLASILAASPAVADDPLETRVDKVVGEAPYRNGHWGILVVDRVDGRVVYQRNADQMFSPASVTKLFSCAAALSELGADHRFQTPVFRRGKVEKDGTLRGDLILRAEGDLCLGGRTGPDGSLMFEDNDHTYAGWNTNASLLKFDPLAGLDHLAREVAGAGIKAVSGEVLIDDRLFDTVLSTGSGPSRVSPIVINDNVIDLTITPGAKAGDTATVSAVPDSSYLTMDAQVETSSEDGKPSIEVHSLGARRFVVRGKIPAGHKPMLRIHEVVDPASFARSLFIEALRRRGVNVAASPLGENSADALPTKVEAAKLTKVAEYTSPPFKEYLRVILKVSHNLHASTLPMLVAAHHGETKLADGLKREGEFLKNLGVDPNAISFGGGAGGSRADLATPRATVALLRAMADRPDFPAIEAALPILGRDGTLAKAVAADSPARGHVRAKTGTYWVQNDLNGKVVLTSKALAGVMETATGRNLAFAFFVNNVPLDVDGDHVTEASAAAGRLLGRLCEVFYADGGDRLNSKSKPDEAGAVGIPAP